MRLLKLVLCVTLLSAGLSAKPVLDEQKHEEVSDRDAYRYPAANPEEEVVNPPEVPEPIQRKPGLNWGWVEPVIMVLCILVIALGLYFLLRHLGWISNPRNEQTVNSYTRYEQDIEDIQTVDIQTPLQDAIADQNWRLAVRLCYLDLLKHLNQEGAITWRKAKTNHDYLNELTGDPKRSHFKHFLNGYELVWYGERTLDEDQYHSFEKIYQTLTSKLP